ncbi:MAG TPA: hypothetical protein VJS44_17545 [Pyrinomonadaceae bacterium]|nr:hypothetical protein [Pyrinomonadaceae bacterium]
MTFPQGKTTPLVVKGLCLLLSGVGIGWLIGLSVSPVIHIIITSLIALAVSVTGTLAGINIDQKESAAEPDDKPKRRVLVEVNPVPLMLVVIGLAIGSSIGVYARTNSWLGPDPNSFVEKWKDTELTKREIVRRLFDDLYPPRAGSTTSTTAGDSAAANAQSTGQASGPGASTENSNSSTTKAAADAGASGAAQPPKSAPEADAGKSETSANPDSAMTKSKVSALFSGVDANDCAEFRAARDESLRDVMDRGVGGNEEARKVIRQCPDIRCLRGLVTTICPR